MLEAMTHSDEPEEMLDLVNDQDVVVGSVAREEVTRQGMNLPGFVRAANAFIINSKGEIWVPRRGPHKRIAPNGLDYSAGEHVQAGETYVAAMVRGFREELNLEVAEKDLEYVGKINNAPAGIPYFNSVFIYRSNNVPHYNKDDFVAYEWLTPAALQQRLQAGEPAKRDITLGLELLSKHKQ
jgi:isopentenyldiphosphate isomerase